jgi:MoaA/NifB/PqqE/SkfB family radical SAM enzyme
MSGLPKYACQLPMHHMAIRPDGRVMPCCYFRHEHVPTDLNLSLEDPFNHPFMQQNRESVLNDEMIPGCSKCYEDEKTSGNSMRTDIYNSPYNFLNLPTDDTRGKVAKLTNIDVTFSNVCNNKCRMCGPELSTQWYSDAKKMGYPFEKRGVIAENKWIETANVSDLTFIKFLGGEPLMEQEKMIQLLQKCNREKLVVHITTNGTLLPNETLHNLLTECEGVYMTVSVDQFGQFNEFLRKGSNWDTTIENMFTMKEHYGKHTTTVHSVTSIYNVNLCNQLIDFCINERFYQKNAVVDGPNWMMPRNLPKKVKAKLIKLLNLNIQNTNLPKHLSYLYDATAHYELLINELEQDGDFGMFLRNDTRLNIIRNEHWKDYNPWLWNELKPYFVETQLEDGQLDYLNTL